MLRGYSRLFGLAVFQNLRHVHEIMPKIARHLVDILANVTLAQLVLILFLKRSSEIFFSRLSKTPLSPDSIILPVVLRTTQRQLTKALRVKVQQIPLFVNGIQEYAHFWQARYFPSISPFN